MSGLPVPAMCILDNSPPVTTLRVSHYWWYYLLMTNNVFMYPHCSSLDFPMLCCWLDIEVFHNVALSSIMCHQEKMTHTHTERDKKVVLHNILQNHFQFG